MSIENFNWFCWKKNEGEWLVTVVDFIKIGVCVHVLNLIEEAFSLFFIIKDV